MKVLTADHAARMGLGSFIGGWFFVFVGVCVVIFVQLSMRTFLVFTGWHTPEGGRRLGWA
jgi:hypothetical protein